MTLTLLRFPAIAVTVAMAVAAGLAACDDERDVLSAGGDAPLLSVGLDLSSTSEPVGGFVAVAIRATVDEPEVVAGVQGLVRFDPSRLRYAGQGVDRSALSLVNSANADHGEIRVLAMSPVGLSRRALTLVFQVAARDYRLGLRYEHESAITRGLVELRTVDVAPAPTVARNLGVPEAREVAPEEWIALLQPLVAAYAVASSANAVPGALRYGDTNLDGKIDATDVVQLADLALREPPSRDSLAGLSAAMLLVGNVRPITRGQAGTSDSTVGPPSADEPRVINVVDVLTVAAEVMGRDQPLVGEVVPERIGLAQPRGTDSLAGDAASETSELTE